MPHELPFLRSQKFYILRPDADPRAAVHPERFHPGQQQDEGQGDEQARPDKAWEELPRPDLLAGAFQGRSLHRVALTTDAGLGKSYNLAWLRYELNDRARGPCAFLVSIGSLESPADLIEMVLVPEVRFAPGNGGEDPERLKDGLERLQHRGQIVLLLDGLDMADDAHVAGLACLLHPRGEWANCRVVLAGRPFALERHWDRLFSHTDWQFVQIAEFDAAQQRAALGKLADGSDRYGHIPQEARNILTTPRVLEYLRPLEADQLDRLKTVSDVYWQACEYMLGQALGGDVDVLTSEHYLAILGALAFTMYARTERHVGPDSAAASRARLSSLGMTWWPETRSSTGELRPNLARIPSSEMTEFLNEARGRLAVVGESSSRAEFVTDLKELSRLNLALNHGWLDVKRVGGVREDLLWRNASLQEFFAAYWVTRWGGESDARLLRDWVVDPLTGNNRGFYWLWRYASEMPDEVVRPNRGQPPRSSWLAAMAPLYSGPVRSTEFIYHSWERMRGTQAQRDYLAEFPALLRAQNAVAVELHTSLEPIPGGTFEMGTPDGEFVASVDEKPPHPVTLSAFCMNRFTVTNAQYRLFDPQYRDKDTDWYHWGEPMLTRRLQLQDNRRPVVNVSWYDAWCFARWAGYRLPTEAEWEYACRGGAAEYQVFHYGDSLSSRQANFNGSYSYEEVGRSQFALRARPIVQEVGSYEPNAFGLYDMHGNVWEWCQDWYAFDFYEREEARRGDPVNNDPARYRVLRGGGYDSYGRNCRSAYRNREEPGVRRYSIGFRLAADPGSLEPGQAPSASRREPE